MLAAVPLVYLLIEPFYGGSHRILMDLLYKGNIKNE